jgi:hypothetical protein
MEEGTRSVIGTRMNGKPFDDVPGRWRFDEGTDFWSFILGAPGSPQQPSGQPLPTGRWEWTVSVDGEKVDEASLRLVNRCP